MNATCLFQVPQECAETWQLSSVLNSSKLLLLLFKYIYIYIYIYTEWAKSIYTVILYNIYRIPTFGPPVIYRFTIYKSVSDMYDYTGKHMHFINSMTGMNHLQIIFVTVTVILQLHLSHYLIGLCFLQGFLLDTQCVLATGIFEP
jgi:hypothetical protein